MAFSESSWQNFPDTGRSTGAYNIFCQGGTIDYGTHVPVPVNEFASCIVQSLIFPYVSQ